MRYRQSAGWEFLGGCGSTTSATSINDRGDALTYYYFAATGVQFVGEGYFMLGSLIDPSQGVWNVQAGGANGINNARQIIAAARAGSSGPIGAVRLTPIVSGCPADFNADGFLDFTDFDEFVVSFEAGDSQSDFNGDGFLDFTDFDAFVSAFEVGC